MDDFTPEVLLLSQLLLFTLLYYIVRRKYWNRDFQSKSQSLSSVNPSSPPKLRIIGHLHLLTDMPHHTFTQPADQLGPIVYLQLGRVPTVVICSSQLARLVLKTHDHVFASRPKLLAAQYLSFGCSDVTFSAYGPYWRQARKICVAGLLSSKRVNSFQLVRDEEVKRLLSFVKSHCGSETDMSKLFFTLANDILCRVAFAKRFTEGSGEGKKRPLVSVLTETQ